MGENELLRAARERTESRRHAGERLSRHELAELANAHLWTRHGRKVELDAHYVAKLERGVIRWPNARYREAFRAILGNASDAELGFVNPRRAAEPVREDSVVTPVPRQLPPASGRFTGRAAELAVLGECGAGVTVLSGAGGIGKTSLALHWAHRAAGDFPDGQLFADLRGFGPDGPPMDPSVVLGGFLRALGVAAADLPADSPAQQGLYRSLLAGKRVLVVLDNASDTAQVLPLLPGAGSCAAVVTSRRVLTGVVTAVGAHHLAVDPLGDDQARALLERHLGVARPAAEPVATAELIRLCGGFPLALAVFAARAAASPRVPLAAFAAELRDLGLGAFENDDPAASLPAVLSWSCRALTEEERFVFAHLGVAPGQDIGLASVVNLTALRPAGVRKALRGLTEASLVTRSARDRYALHDLVRQYAATCLPGTPEPALRRLTDFQLATGHAADRLLAPHRPRQVVFPEVTPHHADLPADATAALAWLDDEHQSLLAAQHAAQERGWHDVVWRMAWVLHTYTYRPVSCPTGSPRGRRRWPSPATWTNASARSCIATRATPTSTHSARRRECGTCAAPSTWPSGRETSSPSRPPTTTSRAPGRNGATTGGRWPTPATP
ncbi:NB-ARC domain-containing protein [Lentzea kentuckyensis]|uniref:NB-ARC domain-containing protein n=1 Tax=Lentzea kentuckyensis TaxID=360086 RepID=UPI001FE65502|nr:NB-ARC domain-containing protein [Lentzea kentuckyensis]